MPDAPPPAPAFPKAAETWNRRFGGDDFLCGTGPNQRLTQHAHTWLANGPTETLLRAAFASLDIPALRIDQAEIHEGAGHHALSALIGRVARRR